MSKPKCPKCGSEGMKLEWMRDGSIFDIYCKCGFHLESEDVHGLEDFAQFFPAPQWVNELYCAAKAYRVNRGWDEGAVLDAVLKDIAGELPAPQTDSGSSRISRGSEEDWK